MGVGFAPNGGFLHFEFAIYKLELSNWYHLIRHKIPLFYSSHFFEFHPMRNLGGEKPSSIEQKCWFDSIFDIPVRNYVHTTLVN